MSEETIAYMFKVLLHMNPEDDEKAFERFADRMRYIVVLKQNSAENQLAKRS